MQVQKILNWLSATEDFHTTKILKQHWKESKYSYRTAPRPDFGMLLVIKGSIDFVTDGEALTARAGNLVFLPKYSRYEAFFMDEADDLLVSFDTSGEEILLHAPIVLSERTPLSCVERFRMLVEEHFYKELTRLQKKGLVLFAVRYDHNGSRGADERASPLDRSSQGAPARRKRAVGR